ncbi:hypothetical protein KOW79_010449 [Hemibagrus wyckioides]|uniref:Uncharacterized protein n=1 Tax=Hemibagrus wyckioides TaxID=337641 RepID=A0A9D3SPN6_9TELE|nr:hypothetical protein KOW79_010449 [Hemibagrus wyckioides]
MPHALSKCRRPSSMFSWTPTAGDGLQDKARTWCRRKRFKWQRKTNTPNFVPVQTETACVPQEEDWEQEIEEFSHKMEEEKEDKLSSNTPYDAEEELKVALCEMSLYSVPHAQRPHQHHYDPSTHHTPPVPWIRRSAHVVKDQFAAAEE